MINGLNKLVKFLYTVSVSYTHLSALEQDYQGAYEIIVIDNDDTVSGETPNFKVVNFAQNITHRAKLSLERLRIHFRILTGKSGKVKTFGIHAVTRAYHIGNAERFEVGSITALVVLKVIDRRRHF